MPLVHAAKFGYLKSFQFLMSRGADVNILDSQKQNLLDIAASNNGIQIIRTLVLNKKLDPFKPNKFDKITPFEKGCSY